MQHFSCALIVFLFFANFLLCFLYKILIQNTSYTHFTQFPFSISLCFILFISFPLSLAQFYSTDHSWEPAELYCEFIIIQLGFLNSHILSTDGSNCETLSERTDHLCPYHKLLSLLCLPLKANRWNCSYIHRQLAHSTLIYSHTGHIHIH